MRVHLVVVLLLFASAPYAFADDVVFVQTDTAGVYEGRRGDIVALTPTHVVLRSTTGEHLFARDAVHRVVVSGQSLPTDRSHWQATLGTYWNTDRSPLVKAVQSFPIVGQPLRVLDNIPTSVASALATIAVCIALLWAAYKAYELTIVGRETHRLSRLRLQLEIAKIRHEAVDLSRKLGFRDSVVLEALDLPLPDPPKTVNEDVGTAKPEARHSRFLAPFMSSAERDDQRYVYRAEAQVAHRRGRAHARWLRIKRTAWLAVGEIFCGLYGIFSLFGSVGFLLPADADSAGPENASAAAALLVLGLFLCRQAVRLGLKLRDVRRAYIVASTPESKATTEILGTA